MISSIKETVMSMTQHAEFKSIIEGLQILKAYPRSRICAEHDELIAGPPLEDIMPSDIEALESLGWNASGRYDSFYIFV